MIEHIEQGTLAPNIRACIALTSWKKRINTVGLTIYNLFETCGPDYHIVLTLAEEEFPRKEQELPRDLVLMNRAGVFEILWCKRNVKSFKKWLFCAAKYPKLPVITADDDCIYTCNYAERLYNKWVETGKKYIITNNGMQYNYLYITRGPNTLFPPHWLRMPIEQLFNRLSMLTACNDDAFYSIYNFINKYKVIDLNETQYFIFHDTIAALSEHGYNMELAINQSYQILYYRPIISTDCMIGHLHKEYNMKYTHPFFWCVIHPADLLALMVYWNSIDFTKLRVEESNILDDKYTEYQLIIDDKVHVHFIHIKESPIDKTPRKVQHTKYGGDIFYCNPPKLILEQFNRRMAYCKKFDAEPVFLVEENPAFGYTYDIIKSLALNSPKPLYIITSKPLHCNGNVKLLPISQKLDNDYSSGRTLRNIMAVRNILFRNLTTIM